VRPISLRAEIRPISVALRAQGKTIAHKGRQSQTTTNNRCIIDSYVLASRPHLDLDSGLEQKHEDVSRP
jgi:hypothetical protein